MSSSSLSSSLSGTIMSSLPWGTVGFFGSCSKHRSAVLSTVVVAVVVVDSLDTLAGGKRGFMVGRFIDRDRLRALCPSRCKGVSRCRRDGLFRAPRRRPAGELPGVVSSRMEGFLERPGLSVGWKANFESSDPLSFLASQLCGRGTSPSGFMLAGLVSVNSGVATFSEAGLFESV